MPKKGLNPKKSEPLFLKQLEFDFKKLFLSLGKAIKDFKTLKWEQVLPDIIEFISSISFKTEEDKLAFTLIFKSINKAIFELVQESSNILKVDEKVDIEVLIKSLNLTLEIENILIDKQFFDRPGDLKLINDIKPILIDWLRNHGLADNSAISIANRLPIYFIHALVHEWRKDAVKCKPLLDALDTPFKDAEEREWGWIEYNKFLQKQVEESIFDEPFCLRQLYIPLNAFYIVEVKSDRFDEERQISEREKKKVVVKLEEEFTNWLANKRKEDSIRIVSGGPGSGKSSFMKIFAAKLSESYIHKVLYIPLHLIDPTKELTNEIDLFIKKQGMLTVNPIDIDNPERELLIVFDGLDELAAQGKAAKEAAEEFINAVISDVDSRNSNNVWLKVLISGRELIVQENESMFRREGQVLNLLPFKSDMEKKDYRDDWWKNYGRLTGKNYKKLPDELKRKDLDDITSQPLLNYLMALSFDRGKLDFSKEVNLNAVYYDLIEAVHERGYEQRPHIVMKFEDFIRVLEEVGLASWHGDGKCTTIRKVEELCHKSNLSKKLTLFEKGAKEGILRLLAAFFFRKHGTDVSGEHTFEFTHKSFGEYLTARRISLAVKSSVNNLKKWQDGEDDVPNEKEILKRWVEITGPTPMSNYLLKFVRMEIKLKKDDVVEKWQNGLSSLFSYVMKWRMPMEMLQGISFKEAQYKSRNAEETLFAVINACALVTGEMVNIDFPTNNAFGSWLKKIQGQRTGGESPIAFDCLSHLNLQNALFLFIDLYEANLRGADLREANLRGADLIEANLRGADLFGANLRGANLRGANLFKANLEGAILLEANLVEANLREANLREANLEGADHERANFEGAKLKGTILDREKKDKTSKK